MKLIVRHILWLSMLLVVGMACFLGIVYAQEQGRADQPMAPGFQAGDIPGPGRMGEQGQMT